jgi:hypothetical protein
MMTRRILALLLTCCAGSLSALVLPHWRAHRYALLMCKHGGAITLWVSGDMALLTDDEREFLNATALRMESMN